MEIDSKNIQVTKNNKIKIVNNGGKPGIICFQMSWCQYCERNKKPFKNAQEILQNHFNLYVIEGDASDKNAKLFKRLSDKSLIKGYPTILLFNEKGIVYKRYEGERTRKAYVDLCYSEFVN